MRCARLLLIRVGVKDGLQFIFTDLATASLTCLHMCYHLSRWLVIRQHREV